MDFATVASVGGLVNAAVSTAKTVRDLAKDSSDSKLKNEISSLYDALLDIKAKVLEIDDENRSLKMQLAMKDDIEGPIAPHGYYYQKSDRQHPLCPKCIQKQPSTIAFMGNLQQGDFGHSYRICKICKHLHYEQQ